MAMVPELQGEPVEILLVEDNQDHAELIVRTLADHQVANRITHVSDGETALDYLYRRGVYTDEIDSPRPHLILLDLRLPKMSGMEILKRIKTDSGLLSIPVVILTTSEADIDINRSLENHANSYLVKPVDFEKFQELIQLLGFYWLVWSRQSTA